MYVPRSFLLILPLVCFLSSTALAQTKMTWTLAEPVLPSVSKAAPTFVYGDKISGQTSEAFVIEGRAELRKTDTILSAHTISYNQSTDRARAQGNVLMNRMGNRYWGPELELDVTNFKGFFSQPSYEFLKNKATGSADRVDFVSERLAVAKNATFSTCPRPSGENGKPWQPDWLLRADEVIFDVNEDIATASGASLRFKDVPVLAFPSFSFPMSDKRKSGFLTPNFASDSQSGFEYTQPYYWNIAPNQDLTLLTTAIEKRGFNLGADYRHLAANSTSQLRADYLPNDKLYAAHRWGYAIDHRAITASPFVGSSDIQWRVQSNRVSDDGYWRDFPRANAALTQRLLSNEVSASAQIAGWSTSLRSQRWQTLQESTAPITPPFDRAPQLNTKRGFNLPNDLYAHLEADFTSFSSRTTLTNQPNSLRSFGVAQLSQRYQTASGYVVPKIQLHATSYQLGAGGTSADTSLQRFVPTLSLDSGLVFERDTALWGTAFSQTLEPRVFYVKTPYRNQSHLPNYDSGAKDFTLSTIYSENSYVGQDRLADMNMLTLGLTSRFLNPQSGAEALRLGIAQRYRLSDQLVTLPGEAAQTERYSDWLMNAAINVNPKWSVDSTVQFGATTNVAERTTLSTRFNPSAYRNVYASYRMQNNVSEQVDFGWQWPLGDIWGRADEITGSNAVGRGLGSNRWYSVGRLNYSTKDQRLVNAIVGFEYDAECWIGRVVLEQTQLDANTTNQRVMFQLELVGFSRLGISPLTSLRRNIPRYQNLREQTTSPSRFSNYD
jgi:LPS-assembly protein